MDKITTTSLVPFGFAAASATLLGLFPIIVGRRIAILSYDVTASKSARYTLYSIFAAVIGLHLSEAMKGALFGLQYYNDNSISFFVYEIMY